MDASLRASLLSTMKGALSLANQRANAAVSFNL